jgi:hypothetical protein
MTNKDALIELLTKVVDRVRYAISINDMPLLEFSISELEDIIHNLKIDLQEKPAYQAPTEAEIQAQHEFLGKSDE